MKSFVITKEDDGMRLSRFVEKAAPALSKGALYKALRTKHIKLNRKRCDAADRLQEGDVVDIWLDDGVFAKKESRPDFLSAGKQLDVLYEDENIAVLYKPVGLNAHPVKGDYTDNLISRFLRYLYEKGEYDPAQGMFTPALCNRLDRNTEGLVVAGKSRTATEAVCSLIRTGGLQKQYRAVCLGSGPKNGIFDAYLHKNEQKNTVSVSGKEKEGYKPIRTEFHRSAQKDGLALLEVTLHTGRPHQIRAHLAYLGFPILGDPKYGNAAANKKHGAKTQYLAAYALRFPAECPAPIENLGGLQITLEKEPFAQMF
ncbi:MAG: RluA family pseudouridine synthase [Oscillospiraceae bacterium]|nr:RluA family pseudouridine synthase [Oscillospiraceae bacterium]